MLKQRFITASLLAPLALAAVFLLPVVGFSVVMGLVVLIGAWEWANLAVYSRKARYGYVLLVAIILLSISPFLGAITSPILYIASLFWLFASLKVLSYPSTRGIDGVFVKLFIGLLVLIPTWVAMVGLKLHDSGHALLLLLFLLVWGADVGAYFAGKRFGRVKLLPNVSPGKTREGLYGGLIAGLFIGFLFSLFQGLASTAILSVLSLAFVVVVVSVFGDLFESLFKRERGIKDSGSLLPGHGGVLDRVDSITAAAPVFLLGIQLLPIV